MLPFIIRDLGLAKFGLWEAIVALASLSTLITDPAGGTFLWRMSLAWGEGDEPMLRRLVRLGIVLSFVLPVVMVPCALLLQSSVTRLFGVDQADGAAVRTAFVCLVAMVVFSGINGTLGALNSSMQRVRVTSFAQTVGQVAMYAVSMGVFVPAWISQPWWWALRRARWRPWAYWCLALEVATAFSEHGDSSPVRRACPPSSTSGCSA